MSQTETSAVESFAEREAARTEQKARRSPLQSKQQTLAQTLRFLTCMSGQLNPLLREIGSHNSRVPPDHRLNELQNDMRALNSFVAQKLSNAKYLMELMKHEATLRDLEKKLPKEQK